MSKKCKRCEVDMKDGYVMLPCFTLCTCMMCNRTEMTCAGWLEWIFVVVFAPFWTGRIRVWREAGEESR